MYCNQEAVGKAVADFLKESDGTVKREDLWIETMLPQWHLGYNETIANFHDTVQ
jgi:diketogulonate reductase-like aldo/keto reductase